jgi:hypothetical protein
MRLQFPVFFLPLIIAATGTVGLEPKRIGTRDEDSAIQNYFDALIPVVTDIILHQNAGPGIGADVKTRSMSVL